MLTKENERETKTLKLSWNLICMKFGLCVFVFRLCPRSLQKGVICNSCEWMHIGIHPNVGNFVAASHLTLNSDTRRLESRDVALERDYSFDSLFPINFWWLLRSKWNYVHFIPLNPIWWYNFFTIDKIIYCCRILMTHKNSIVIESNNVLYTEENAWIY